jgi:hypothetical protein
VSKARKSSEGKKFLAVLAMLIVVATPLGQHAYMGVATFFSKIVAGSIMHSLPKPLVATPTITPTPSK